MSGYTPEQAGRVRATIAAAMSSPAGRKARGRRHPLEVTSDRIADHLERYHNRLSGPERDELSDARRILEDLLP